MPDILTLSAALAPAGSLGKDGLPTKFLVLGYGMVTFTQEAERIAVNFTRELADKIVATGKSRGVSVPMDMEHSLHSMSEAIGLDEMTYLRTKALPGENPAAGFVRLTAEGDGLYAIVQQWAPRAALLLKEKLYKYHSPVIRGLLTGSPWISSIALTNVPAVDFQEPLVAKATTGKTTTKGNPTMLEFLKKVRGALGLDAEPALVLSAEGALDEAGQGEILGTIAALKSLAGDNPDAAALKAENDQLKAVAETAERQALIDTGLREGKLTVAMLESDAIKGMDTVALKAYNAATPVNSRVPVVAKVGVAGLPEPDAIETSDAVKIRKMFGTPDPNQKKGE